MLVVALCFLAGVVGWWINQPDEQSFSKVDIGFLTDMETHHNGAINMSFDYLDRSHDPVVKHFAQEIISSQSQELAAMNSYLNQAGGADVAGDGSVAMAWMGHPVRPADMPGMPTKAELAELDESSGARGRRPLHPPDDPTPRRAGSAWPSTPPSTARTPACATWPPTMAKVQRTEIAEINSRRVADRSRPDPPVGDPAGSRRSTHRLKSRARGTSALAGWGRHCRGADHDGAAAPRCGARSRVPGSTVRTTSTCSGPSK